MQINMVSSLFIFRFYVTNKIEALHCRGFNEAVNGFSDEGWNIVETDGTDDVTIVVNSSPSKLAGTNLYYATGLPSSSNAVLCAKASMLLQV